MPPFAIDFIKVEKNGLKSAHSFWNMMIKLGFFSSIRREEQKKGGTPPHAEKTDSPVRFFTPYAEKMDSPVHFFLYVLQYFLFQPGYLHLRDAESRCHFRLGLVFVVAQVNDQPLALVEFFDCFF